MLTYFKSRWPEPKVPEGEPTWSYYEVQVERDVVTRTIELFADGQAIRNTMELAAREGPDQRSPEHRSLVYGHFLKDEQIREALLDILKSEFDTQWHRAVDKPWP